MEKIFEQIPKKQENVSEVETPSAKYDIVYSLHNQPVKPETIEQADAIILELVGNYETQEKVQKHMEFISREQHTYHQIIKSAAEKQKPVFLVDMSTDAYATRRDAALNVVLLPVIEAMIAAGLVFSGIKGVAKKEKMDRRSFLKLGAKMTAAAYLSLPQASRLLSFVSTDYFRQVPDEESFSRKTEKFVHKIKSSSHPELYSNVVNVRNNLIAEKSEAIARMLNKKLGRKPQLALLTGASHFGLEESLSSDPFERINSLKKDLGYEVRRERIIACVEFEAKAGNEPQKFSISLLEDPALK